MVTSNRADVQVFLDQPHGEGMVVSCYADTSVVQGFEPHWLGHFKSEVSRVLQFLEVETLQAEFEENLSVIRELFESNEARKARGLAIFAGVRRGLKKLFPLDVPVPHRLVVGDEMYVVPLIEAINRQAECLVVVTNSHHARIYGATPGQTRLLAEVDEVVPKQRRASGQRRGKEQGHAIERHRQDVILHYQKDLAREVEKAWNGAMFRGILLLGHQDVLDQFRERLPKSLASQVMHQAVYGWNSDKPEIQEAVREAVDKATQDRDLFILRDLSRRLEEGYAVTAGPLEVLDSLRNGQAAYVVLGPDSGLVASKCTRCQWVFAQVQPSCSFCQAPCKSTNLWQQIVMMATRHKVAVHFVKPDSLLTSRGGAAAVLSRQ